MGVPVRNPALTKRKKKLRIYRERRFVANQGEVTQDL